VFFIRSIELTNEKAPTAILLLLFSSVSAQETIAVIEFEGNGDYTFSICGVYIFPAWYTVLTPHCCCV